MTSVPIPYDWWAYGERDGRRTFLHMKYQYERNIKGYDVTYHPAEFTYEKKANSHEIIIHYVRDSSYLIFKHDSEAVEFKLKHYDAIHRTLPVLLKE